VTKPRRAKTIVNAMSATDRTPMAKVLQNANFEPIDFRGGGFQSGTAPKVRAIDKLFSGGASSTGSSGHG
jgi:hypothetical protein